MFSNAELGYLKPPSYVLLIPVVVHVRFKGTLPFTISTTLNKGENHSGGDSAALCLCHRMLSMLRFYRVIQHRSVWYVDAMRRQGPKAL